jgi:hypothetical protein
MPRIKKINPLQPKEDFKKNISASGISRGANRLNMIGYIVDKIIFVFILIFLL